MSSSIVTPPLTLDAFLRWECARLERYELVGGVVQPVADATEGRSRIVGNLAATLHAQLRGTPRSLHGSKLKVAARSANAVMYPDLLVRCGPRDDRRTSIDDPVVVVEVLSESTARHDLTRKRIAYETIPSLRRIVYVAADEARIDMRVRGVDGTWRDESVEGLEAVMVIAEVAAEVSMAEVYEGSALAA